MSVDKFREFFIAGGVVLSLLFQPDSHLAAMRLVVGIVKKQDEGLLRVLQNVAS